MENRRDLAHRTPQRKQPGNLGLSPASAQLDELVDQAQRITRGVESQQLRERISLRQQLARVRKGGFLGEPRNG
jgi:hypothetical protein